eukprot:PhM_4_TR9224/c0_g1_i2/m.20804
MPPRSTHDPQRRYRIIVYGATGYTGCLVSRYLVENNVFPPNEWTIAGRNRIKLAHLLDELKSISPFSCPQPHFVHKPTFVIANTDKFDELTEMTEQCDVLINCAGPFMANNCCGGAVIEACISTGTHYVDVTGEPQFIRHVIEKYHTSAQSRGVVIVPSCGFDCVPVDLSVSHYVRQCLTPGVFAVGASAFTVRTYVTVDEKGGFSDGTKMTFMTSLKSFAEAKRINNNNKNKRKNVMRDRNVLLPRNRNRPHWSPEIKRWVIPMPSADATVVRRSFELLSSSSSSEQETTTTVPIFHTHYLTCASFWHFCKLAVIGVVIAIMMMLLSAKNNGLHRIGEVIWGAVVSWLGCAELQPVEGLSEAVRPAVCCNMNRGPDAHELARHGVQIDTFVTTTSSSSSKEKGHHFVLKTAHTYQTTAACVVFAARTILTGQMSGGVLRPGVVTSSTMIRDDDGGVLSVALHANNPSEWTIAHIGPGGEAEPIELTE